MDDRVKGKVQAVHEGIRDTASSDPDEKEARHVEGEPDDPKDVDDKSDTWQRGMHKRMAAVGAVNASALLEMEEKAKHDYYVDLIDVSRSNLQEIEQKANAGFYQTNLSHPLLSQLAENPSTTTALIVHAGAPNQGLSADQGQDQDQPQGGQPGQNNSGLVVATEVLQEDPENLPQAEEYNVPNSSSNNRTAQEKQESNIQMALFVCCGLCLVVGVVLLVLFTTRSDNSYKEEGVPSMSPTANPIMEQVISYLPHQTIMAFNNSEAPQLKALDWMLKDPNLLEYIDHDWRVRQRFALVTFFHATNGGNWTDSLHWLSYSHHECSWFDSGSIRFRIPGTGDKYFRGNLSNPCRLPATNHDNDTNDTMIILHEENDPVQASYKQLWLHQNNLDGYLPNELFWLTSLQTLSIFFNKINGTLSSDIGKLQSLQAAILSFTDITGTIPSEIGMMSNKLAFFLLEETQVTGTIPTEFGGLSKMETLNLDQNLLTGEVSPALFRTGTQLNGMDSNQGSGISSNLVRFHLYRNLLTGTLPTEIGFHGSLEFLLIFGNDFVGTLPTEVAVLTSLQKLCVFENQLHGPIPSEVGMLNQSLIQLSLHKNYFNSSIPTQLGMMSTVRIIELQHNLLSGQLPSEIAAPPTLTYFWHKRTA